MDKEIVRIDSNRAYTDTRIIAEGVGLKHKQVKELLLDYRHTEILSRFETAKVSNGGRPLEYIILDELQTTFLITLMRNSKKVVAFKEKLAKEFFRQRQVISSLIAQRENPDWQDVRKDGKIIYRQKTDIIKDFVEYATKQGSKSAKMYYINFSKMENTSLFFFEQKYKDLREVMSIKQLMQVSTADTIIEKALQEGMDSNMHYKDIYLMAKERIIAFSDIIGKSQILSLDVK